MASYVFETGYEYDELGNVERLVYPRCLHEPCAGTDPARAVDFAYTRGFLSSIPGFASRLSYQLGGMLHYVEHANGVTETIATSARRFQRPHEITTSGVTTGNWSSGVYSYDGNGNVKRIGSQLFTYDKMSRLLEGQVEVGGALKSQKLTYDRHGNIRSLTTGGSTCYGRGQNPP